MNDASGRTTAEISEYAYRKFHNPGYISPDPLELVYQIAEPLERELAAFIASSFALGRVQSILTCVRSVFERLRLSSGSLRAALLELSFSDLQDLFYDFVYRFFGQDEVASFLDAVGSVLRQSGTLEAEFARGIAESDMTSLPALARFSRVLTDRAQLPFGILVSDPTKGASKRLHLFLRWMVRHDDVDPGGWSCLTPEKLIVPMDTHMLRISRALGLTRRKTADLRAAIEVTEAFRAIRPDDPVRYDFSLTRYGIHPEGRKLDSFF
ncbi:MAG TPA: TIGR02757 family protein [Spirochaetia bacterium]|nr:TIGR02757 family protein [Spirochaetia bacterium]